MNIKMPYDPYSSTPMDFNEEDRLRKSIFVSIVSYKDLNSLNTLIFLLENSKRPQNIFISLVVTDFQASSQQWVKDIILFCDKNKHNIKLNVVDLQKNTTYGKLKKIADSEYNKQDYYMSISSGSAFDPHWDDILIKQYSSMQNIYNEKLILTGDPRKFLLHDEVVEDFVFFTNHKTKVSMQREEYDGCRIPVSGYNNFFNEKNMNDDASVENFGRENTEHLIQRYEINEYQDFLSKHGFVKFNHRKFIKNEYVALSYGLDCNFIFCDAKQYFKNKIYHESLVDENQFNFYSFINLIKYDFSIISFRFIPIYKLFEHSIFDVKNNFMDLYDEQEYKNSDGLDLINRLIYQDIISDNRLNILLSVDWEHKQLKLRDLTISDPLIETINLLISLYNFSVYENSLHWNKKC